MLVESLPNIENYVGKNIVPTYSYWRMYENGADLKRHKDTNINLKIIENLKNKKYLKNKNSLKRVSA